MIKDEQSAQTQTIVADVQALATQCDFKTRTPRSDHEDYALEEISPRGTRLNDGRKQSILRRISF